MMSLFRTTLVVFHRYAEDRTPTSWLSNLNLVKSHTFFLLFVYKKHRVGLTVAALLKKLRARTDISPLFITCMIIYPF